MPDADRTKLPPLDTGVMLSLLLSMALMPSWTRRERREFVENLDWAFEKMLAVASTRALRGFPDTDTGVLHLQELKALWDSVKPELMEYAAERRAQLRSSTIKR